MDILEGVAKALLSPRRFYRDAMRERESLQRTTSSYRSSAAARTTTTSREIRSLYEEIMWPNDKDKDGGQAGAGRRQEGTRSTCTYQALKAHNGKIWGTDADRIN